MKLQENQVKETKNENKEILTPQHNNDEVLEKLRTELKWATNNLLKMREDYDQIAEEVLKERQQRLKF